MTSLGKALVITNLALSLLVAAWALDLYATRIDWSSRPGKDGAPDGELVSRLARIKKLSEALGPASNGWNAGREQLANLDGREEKTRSWYESELAFNRTGATRAKPAHVIKMVNGQPELSKTDDRPVMEPGRDQFGQPLQSLAGYNQSAAALHQQILTVTQNLAKTIDEDAALTNQLVGEPGGAKGLRQRIDDERAKRNEVINEQNFVRPLLINAVVESDLVLKRKRSLEARIKELEKVGVASESGR
jgi:hypothetical protein